MAGLIPREGITKEEADQYIDNLHYILGKLNPELLFSENKTLLECMTAFREETENQGPLDERSLLDMLISERAPPEIQVKYTERFARFANIDVSPAKFRYAVSRFLKQKEEEMYTKALNEAYTIQTQGATVNKEKLIGYQDSKRYLQQRMFEIERGIGNTSIPEGDVRDEADEVVAEYDERKTAPEQFIGLKSGIGPLDDITNGIQPGELGFICGYTEVGKSFMTLQWAFNAAIVQGKNVAIGTAEVLYNQYRRRIALRHARNATFNLPQGIDSDAYKHGRLTPQEEQSFRDAMRDFKTNKAYGRIYLFQIPKGANLAWINNKITAIDARWEDIGGLNGFFLDSLNLVTPTIQRKDGLRTSLNDMIKEAKDMARGFKRGKGLPFVSPWHANRKSWEEAVKNGYYTLASWSEADELEKSADILLWLLRTDPNNTTSHEILAGLEKYRDGKGHQRFSLFEDFASSYLGSVATSAIPSNMGGQIAPTFGNAPDGKAQGLF